jgi:DMSO/TMAO reductase YedYZ molybdopterin-dependent catalytic subunit
MIRWKLCLCCALFLSLPWTLCPAQDHIADTTPATNQVHSLELRGDLPNPRRIDASDLQKLPRAETHTTDTHNPGKASVYAGTPLVDVLKAGGLVLDSGMPGIRETVTVTVLIEAADGYRAVFSLAELNPELTDRVVLLADTKDGQPLPPQEGPFRIIVPGEKRPVRWVRQVRTIVVHKN